MEIDFIGMPMNMGCRHLGVEQGPGVVREIVFGRSRHHKWNDCGDIECESFADVPEGDNALMPYIKPILAACGRLRDAVACSLEKGHFPFVAGGDHVLTWGSLSGVLQVVDDLKCLYVDAHGDFNSAAASPSHNVHGMHLCYLMGFEDCPEGADIQCRRHIRSENVFFTGTRSLDAYEKAVAASRSLAISRDYPCGLCGSENLHVSFDIDVLDPEVAPGTGVPEAGGLTLAQAMKVLTEAFRRNRVCSFDLVEFNPMLDVSGRTRAVVEDIIDRLDSELLP